MANSVGAVSSLKVHINAYRQSPTPEPSVTFSLDGAVKTEQRPEAQELPGAVYEPSATRDKALYKALDGGVVYERGTREKPATYSIGRMSADERAALVQRMKDDAAQKERQFLDIVHRSVSEQRRFLTTHDDYFGVRQTSARLFDFALALAGDDEDKMRRMQAAMQKGFQQAARAYGGALPSVSHETLSAANRLFEDYYQSKQKTPPLTA